MNDLQYCNEIIQIVMFLRTIYFSLNCNICNIRNICTYHQEFIAGLQYNLWPQYNVLRVIHFAILAQGTTSTEMPILKFLLSKLIKLIMMTISVGKFQSRGYKFTLQHYSISKNITIFFESVLCFVLTTQLDSTTTIVIRGNKNNKIKSSIASLLTIDQPEHILLNQLQL